MAIVNAALPTLASNTHLIKNKLNWVISTYLESAIEAYNTLHGLTGPVAIQPPRQVNLSVSAFDLRFGVDGWPALSIVPVGSTVTPNIYFASQDLFTDYDITCAAASDGADLDNQAQQSKELSLIVANMLQERLPEPPGQLGVTSVYAVDIVRTVAGRPQSVGAGLWALANTTTIRVRSRAQMNTDAAWIPDTYEPFPAVQANFTLTGTVNWQINAAPVTTATTNLQAGVTWTAGDVLSIDFSGTNIPAGSAGWYVIRRERAYVSLGALPFVAGDETVTIPLTSTPQTGDIVSLLIEVDGSRNELNFPARLTVV